ncbi:MAG: hypothetical protein ACKVGZ_21325 [Alphaproteobacteria bacterium]
MFAGNIKKEFVFTDASERSLKNTTSRSRVWLWPRAGEADATSVATLMLSHSSQPSFAVLPFQNLSSASDNEFFANGIINAFISRQQWKSGAPADGSAEVRQ